MPLIHTTAHYIRYSSFLLMLKPTATMQQFAYDRYPFNSISQIRVLELTDDAHGHARWSFAAPMTVRATSSGVGDNVAFAALSYEWGANEELVPFEVDGQTLGIRTNLMHFLEALPELRAKEKTLPALFWIDSLCIYQEDGTEIPNQIRLLEDIYSHATCVISWLGPTADRSDFAMEYVPGFVENEDKALGALLNRRYWSRLWMVQEVVLGRQWWIASGVDIVDGGKLMSLLTGRHLTPSNQRDLPRHGSQFKAYTLINERRRFWDSGPIHLLEMLTLFSTLDSKFSIDQICALLAVSKSSSNTDHMQDVLAPFADNPEAFDSNDEAKDMIGTLLYLDLWQSDRESPVPDWIKGLLTKAFTKQEERPLARSMRRNIVPTERGSSSLIGAGIEGAQV
jgi:hypothetical protein